MRYDRELRYGGRGPRPGAGELLGRGEYGAEYEAPYRARFHGYGTTSHWLRSRGSYEAGQLRSGLNPVDEFEFEWGEGYVGGRGYGGTNYDYEHGYRVGSDLRRVSPPERPAEAQPSVTATRGVPSPATRGGYTWSEREAGAIYGPARYGYGPYFERLRRRRRSDDELRREVEEALFYDTWVDADRITVEVKDGIVTLKGTLPSYDEVRYAVDDAWDVDGVLGVRSELRVEEPGGTGRQEEGARAAGEAEFWEEPSHVAGEGEGEGEAWAGRGLTETPAAAGPEAATGEAKKSRRTRSRSASGQQKKKAGSKRARSAKAGSTAEGSGAA
jgi:hypothetical protein